MAKSRYSLPGSSFAGHFTLPNIAFSPSAIQLDVPVHQPGRRLDWNLDWAEVWVRDVYVLYHWNGSAWVEASSVGGTIPGYPLDWDPALNYVPVLALVAGAGITGVAASEQVVAACYGPTGSIGTVQVNWSVSCGALPCYYDRGEVNLGDRYSRALWTDQLEVAEHYYKEEWPLSASCGGASATGSRVYGPGPHAPSWAATLAYNAGLILEARGTPPDMEIWGERLADVTEVVWSSDGKYGSHGEATIEDADFATYTTGAGFLRGTVEGDGPSLGAKVGGSWSHSEWGKITSRFAYNVKAFDVLSAIDGLRARATYVDGDFAVPGTVQVEATPGSRRSDPTTTDPLTVTLTDESLAALHLPTGDNKVPGVFWSLDAVSADDLEHGPVYRGAYQAYRQAPLNILRPPWLAAAPSAWTFTPGAVTWEQDEVEATFRATFLAPGDLVATKSLKHHYRTVWSNKARLIREGTAPPDGAPQSQLWQWMFGFDDTHTKRKAGRAGLRWAQTTVPCSGGVVDWANGTPVAVELPAGEAEDIHSYRTYGFLGIRYRWTKANGTAPRAQLRLTIASAHVTVSDSHNTNVSERVEAFGVSFTDSTAVWSGTIEDTGEGEGTLWVDLLTPGAPPLEIVDRLTLTVPWNANAGDCTFELVGMALDGWNPTRQTREGRALLWRAYARRRRYGDEPKLPREYTGFWLWCDGLYALPLPDPELVDWAGASPDGLEFCNSVVADNAEKVTDLLFPFQAMNRILGPWGQEGLYGITQLARGDVAMEPFYDEDGNYFGPSYATDWLEGLEEFGCEDHSGALVAGAWQPAYAIRVGQVRLAEGICWAHEGTGSYEDGGAPIVTYWSKILKSPRVCLGFRAAGHDLLRTGAGQEFALYETDGETAREVSRATADDWGLVFFPRGVQEQRNNEGGAGNPDADRPDFRGDVLTPGTPVAKLTFPAHHAQGLPYWALALIPPPPGDRIDAAEAPWSGVAVVRHGLMRWVGGGETGTALAVDEYVRNAQAGRAPEWTALLAECRRPACAARPGGTFVVAADDPDPEIACVRILSVPPRSQEAQILMTLDGYSHPAVTRHPGHGTLFLLVRHAATARAHVLELDCVEQTAEPVADLGPMDEACGAIHVDPQGIVRAFVPLDETIHIHESRDTVNWAEV